MTHTRNCDKLGMSIFHKPTRTDSTTNKFSVHPYSHKIAPFFRFIHRLLSVPMNYENYNKELSIIRQITSKNNYYSKLADILIKKVNYRKAIALDYSLSTRDDKKNFHVPTYVGELSEKIAI